MGHSKFTPITKLFKVRDNDDGTIEYACRGDFLSSSNKRWKDNIIIFIDVEEGIPPILTHADKHFSKENFQILDEPGLTIEEFKNKFPKMEKYIYVPKNKG